MMREVAVTGDLTRKITLRGPAIWQDEDARLLATTYNGLTDSIARFQREAAQKEQLLSLGRLSTVIAHEVRNPLMIMKASLRSLRPDASPPEIKEAVGDIDEEVDRLNRIVNDVLDFARPPVFSRARGPVLVAAMPRMPRRRKRRPAVVMALPSEPVLVVTDAERLDRAGQPARERAAGGAGAETAGDSSRTSSTGVDVEPRLQRNGSDRVLVQYATGHRHPDEDLPRSSSPISPPGARTGPACQLQGASSKDWRTLA